MPARPQFTLLLVDDDAMFRAGTRRLLWITREALPFDIVEAGDGAQALQVIQRQPVDCVLLDNQMSGGLGLDWIPKFLAAAPDLAVVMITGGGDERTAVEAMKKGAMDYLVKGSMTVESLQRAITNALEKVEMRKTLARQRASLIDAERQKVMVESLATACHHIGQPATVVYTILQMMMKWDLPPGQKQMLQDALASAESLVDDIHRLQAINEYRTVPYLASPGPGGNIVEVPAD
ncbi:MAG: response regulator [bacterium]